MKRTIKTLILTICLTISALLCLTACDNAELNISAFSVSLANSELQIENDTITVSYGKDYRSLIEDIKINAVLEDDKTKELTHKEAVEQGFSFESDIPKQEATSVGNYVITIGYKDIEEKKSINLVVEKATVDVSNLCWNSNEFIYNGKEQCVQITNLPIGVVAVYEGNINKNAGDDYEATATLSIVDSENYNAIPENLATIKHSWKIKKIVLQNLHIVVNPSDFEQCNNAGESSTRYQLLPKDGIIDGEEVFANLYYSYSGGEYSPKPDRYNVASYKNVQPMACIITGDVQNYEFPVTNQLGEVYVCREDLSFNGDDGNYANISTDKYLYFSINVTVPAGKTYNYYIKDSKDKCSYKVFNENFDEVEYIDGGFKLKNITANEKQYKLFIQVSASENVTENKIYIYNHKLTFFVKGEIFRTYYAKANELFTFFESYDPDYIFDGWYSDPNFENKVIDANKEMLITSDLTLYAKQTPVVYKITYMNTKDVENPNPTTYTIETPFTLVDLEDTVDYIFKGWYTNEEYTGSAVTGLSGFGSLRDMTYYAKWEQRAELSPFNYSVDSSKTTITITGVKSEFKDNESLTIPNYVSKLGDRAFEGTKIKTITIPSSVTSIGSNAFHNCISLTSIVIPNSVTSLGSSVFEKCKNLKSVTLGSGITKLGKGTFVCCPSLEELVFNGLITEVDKYLFEKESEDDIVSGWVIIGQETVSDTDVAKITLRLNYNQKVLEVAEVKGKLSTITEPYTATQTRLTSDNTFIEKTFKQILYTFDASSMTASQFENAIKDLDFKQFLYFIFPENAEFDMFTKLKTRMKQEYLFECKIGIDGVETIPDNAFYGVSKVSHIIIGDDVKHIGNSAFSNSTIQYVIIKGAKSIGNFAFGNGNESLISVTLNEGLESIGNYAFQSCKIITDIVIPNSVKTIGDNAFCFCIRLKNLTLGSGLLQIGELAFSGCGELLAVSIPNSVTTIGESAFNGCEKLTTVSIGTGVNKISVGMFNTCKALTSITLPNNITVVEDNAFSHCTNLTNITLSENLTTLGKRVFLGCSKLTNVVLPISVTTMDSDTFEGTSTDFKLFYNGTLSGWSAKFNLLSLKKDDNTEIIPYFYSENKPESEMFSANGFWHYDENGVPTVW